MVPRLCGVWVHVSACHSALLCWDGGQSAACNVWAERTVHNKRLDLACILLAPPFFAVALTSRLPASHLPALAYMPCQAHTRIAQATCSPTGLYVYNKMDICSMEEVRSPAPALPCRHPWLRWKARSVHSSRARASVRQPTPRCRACHAFVAPLACCQADETVRRRFSHLHL